MAFVHMFKAKEIIPRNKIVFKIFSKAEYMKSKKLVTVFVQNTFQLWSVLAPILLLGRSSELETF